MKNHNSILQIFYRNYFPSLITNLKKELSGCNSVLDLGCGRDSPIQFCDTPFSVGVDVFESYLKESRKKNIHDKYIKADLRKVKFKPNSFDAVLALDVLEHFTKKEGLKLMKKMQRWTRKKVIIFTPNGFIEQDEYENNPFQSHKYGWSVKEFRALGYRIYGINGFKPLRKEMADIRFRPEIFWTILSYSTELLVFRYPSLAFQLFAVKDIKS